MENKDLEDRITSLETYCTNQNDINKGFEDQIKKIVKYLNKIGEETETKIINYETRT